MRRNKMQKFSAIGSETVISAFSANFVFIWFIHRQLFCLKDVFSLIARLHSALECKHLFCM